MKNIAAVPVTEVDAGTVLVCDGGFTCIPENTIKEVKRNAAGELFVDCANGEHGLDRQFCKAGEHDVPFDHYIGFWFESPCVAPCVRDFVQIGGALSDAVEAVERENFALKRSLRKMLDVYWEKGDGEPPPEFIAIAARLSGWQLPDFVPCE